MRAIYCPARPNPPRQLPNALNPHQPTLCYFSMFPQFKSLVCLLSCTVQQLFCLFVLPLHKSTWLSMRKALKQQMMQV